MADSDNDSGGGYQKSPSPREHDRLLPIANVGRIMKKALPGNAKISKDAKEIVQECVSEFISFVTGEASDKCHNEKRKTINGDDLLWAMATLGFEDYVDPLKLYLQRFREIEGERTALASRDSSSSAAATATAAAGAANSAFFDGGGEFGGGMGMTMTMPPNVYGSNGPRWDGPGFTTTGRPR
ncbi:nuclear transcription factor Y subunit B-3-like [Cucurbita maxima]|uniref:Nuclear transcription factor Y subunit B-3-like n=1 Tax=Cucurbita maxima TaxID=3661 RepID=A0A6J1HQB9_CUCMA|nr:nuclear transcription factor Y subunit B-3-like [Cucurbita maxima]